MITKKQVNEISFKIIDCAIEVHKHLGPGLLESIYHQCLYDELKFRNLSVVSHQQIPIVYKGKELGDPLRLDLLIADLIIVELKAVENLHPVYTAQLLSYMKLAYKPKGLLINFHTDNITKNMIPLVNNLFAELPE